MIQLVVTFPWRLLCAFHFRSSEHMSSQNWVARAARRSSLERALERDQQVLQGWSEAKVIRTLDYCLQVHSSACCSCPGPDFSLPLYAVLIRILLLGFLLERKTRAWRISLLTLICFGSIPELAYRKVQSNSLNGTWWQCSNCTVLCVNEPSLRIQNVFCFGAETKDHLEESWYLFTHMLPSQVTSAVMVVLS